MDGTKLLGLLALIYSVVNPLNLSAASVVPGNIIISEIMANPAAVSDSNGEWFEVHNLTGNTLDLNGITLSDDGTNSHVVNFGGALTLNPNDYLVFGKNGSSSLNGGYMADYAYSGFSLSNGADEIVIGLDGVELVRLEYGSGFAVSGVSRELAGTVGFPLSGADYALSATVFGAGDLGTPGVAGVSSWSLAVQPVPLPSAVLLLGSGLLGLLGMAARGRN